jgi:hypothetical protein
MDAPVNYLAILVAAIAAFALGFLVHGPLLGKTWMGLMKITPEEMEKGKAEMQRKMPFYMGAAFVQQFVIAFVLSYLSYLTYAETAFDAVALAFWAWLGLTAMPLLNGVLWEKRTVPLYAFNVAYLLASTMIISLIVTLWR